MPHRPEDLLRKSARPRILWQASTSGCRDAGDHQRQKGHCPPRVHANGGTHWRAWHGRGHWRAWHSRGEGRLVQGLGELASQQLPRRVQVQDGGAGDAAHRVQALGRERDRGAQVV
eukprot:CAMPEP_0113825982 /NCGR_PEP_ID=MMETSP0328-20130328/4026_1 /TAXON_ID=39455 /ORGANISM="Alexandrium minutum" /LENGTH=115 /DNA_ID=CAMNT_0000793945 /DNA_START=288 /DNA_END=633 /DNA_ORIENTATION=- /assembly_acc=CAM_ASM_000350